jgi:ribosome-associated protein
VLEIDNKIFIPDTELSFSFARSSGPGGQNVNKTNSKAVLDWNFHRSASIPDAVRQRFLARFGKRLTVEGSLVIASDKHRDQRRNMDECLEKLAQMLREVLTPPKRRKATKPGKGAIERRLKTKKEVSEKKKNRRRLDY